MSFKSSFIAATALLAASLTLSAPVNDVNQSPRNAGAVFTVSQIPNPKKFVPSGPAALAKAYAKYGVAAPVDVVNAVSAVAAATQGTVTATPEQYDAAYLSPVQIGTPAQTVNLDFDTGSADLWVFSSETPSSERTGQRIYTPGSSSTSSKLSGASWQITYGDLSGAGGDVYSDKVTVGGVTVTKQAVEAATSVSSSFTADSNSDGLLGLAFSNINTVKPTKQKTFFDNAKASLAAPLFTADLKKGAPGTYDFGFIDTAKYTGSISYVSVSTANSFWEFTGSGYAVGSGSFVSLSIDAIADTGTTLLLVPDSVVTAYYAKVSGASYSSNAGGYIFPCTSTLPSFTFGAGSYRGVIPGTYMNYASYTTSECYGGIQSDSGIGFSIYGDILLKAQFVVFDAGNTRLGFASKTL